MSDQPAQPKIRSLPQFIAMLEDGDFADDGAKELEKINAALKQASNAQGKGVAKLNLGIEFKIDRNGVVEIKGTMTTKLPDKPRSRTIAWTTPDNFLSPQNPNQPNLPGVIVTATSDDDEIKTA
ncbi:MAG: hypothetical protein AAFX92_03925 [Pseudomonadota bacterium]